MSNNQNLIVKFSKEVADELKYYVYRLIDPRNGETFYVGKGKENRVFAVDKWLLSEIDGIRIYFEGYEAENLKSYIGKRIPKNYCKPGAANPTLYIK